MTFTALADGIQVSPQISVRDIEAAASSGVTHIINNRPDGEEPGQPTNAELAACAGNNGIGWTWVPVIPGQMSMAEVEGMIAALGSAEGDLLAFCRSGTRSTNLWGLAVAATKQLEPADIVMKASSAGYDLSGIEPILQQLYRA